MAELDGVPVVFDLERVSRKHYFVRASYEGGVPMVVATGTWDEMRDDARMDVGEIKAAWDAYRLQLKRDRSFEAGSEVMLPWDGEAIVFFHEFGAAFGRYEDDEPTLLGRWP